MQGRLASVAGAGPSSSSACSSGRVLLAGSGRLPRGTAVVTMAQAAPGEAAAAASTAAPSTTSSSSGSRKASSFVRKHLLNVPAYTPIEPFEVLSARYGRTPQEIVKLDANENPYGPPPEVRQALESMPFPHIYPDPETRRLRKALSELSGVPEDYLLVRFWLAAPSMHAARGGGALRCAARRGRCRCRCRHRCRVVPPTAHTRLFA